MRLEIKKDWMEIVPENEEDEAYIEKVLGLEREGDEAKVVRRNVLGVDRLACIEITRIEPVVAVVSPVSVDGTSYSGVANGKVENKE